MDVHPLQEFLAARQLMASAQSRQEVIEAVRTTGRAACGSDGITIVLREGDLCHYVEEDAIGPLWKGQRFPIASCISGWSMLNASVAAIEDVFADDRIPHDVYRNTFVKSLIMTPIGQSNPVAAIGAYWRSRRAFTERDIATTRSISFAVARAFAQLACS